MLPLHDDTRLPWNHGVEPSSPSSASASRPRRRPRSQRSEPQRPRTLSLCGLDRPRVVDRGARCHDVHPRRQSRDRRLRRFHRRAEEGAVVEAEYDNTDGGITFTDTSGTEFSTVGPLPLPDDDNALIRTQTNKWKFVTPRPNFFTSLIPLLIPVTLLILFFVWMQRRASGQMGNIMSIGRSKAKTYSTERPGTMFDDVAGYDGVKQEITEIVDFLKHPERFTEIGARPQRRAARRPTRHRQDPPRQGSRRRGRSAIPLGHRFGLHGDVRGRGAAVRDLFESARKMGKAIIFIDEIDSIGRKRGAGLGGGHDEREQTLNQMLAEMDGFEGSEGIVMMAATNRPDILDPALLRAGRFDRQVVVPLPELEDRVKILGVHLKGKHTGDDVDVNVIARGTPGMAGADLANLVNEAALFAVRRGSDKIDAVDFDSARDRALLGIERGSMVRSREELERTAYHEAGHALCAAILPKNDPVHKVTIIPTGMALGVTMTLPTRIAIRWTKTRPRPAWSWPWVAARRGPGLQRVLIRGLQRPPAGHGHGSPHGHRVGHERSGRPDVTLRSRARVPR